MSRASEPRRMGVLGTIPRLALGWWLVGSVVVGHITGPFRQLPWILGLVALPALTLGVHWMRVRRDASRIDATGPFGHASHVFVFFVLLVAPDYVPALWFTTDAALLFYGTAMLVAAVRGQLDCEVLALSNWLLRRDDRVGCLVFAPMDHLDRRSIRSGA